MKSKLAIFDLDGTLFDTRRINFQAYKRAMEQSGNAFPMSEEAFNQDCYGRNYKDFLIHDFQLSKEQAEKVHILKKKLYPGLLGERVRRNKTLFDILQSISGQYYTALVTTASKENTYEILEYYGCGSFFELLLTAEDVTRLKPDAEGYLKAMRYFSVNPEDTMIFEDMEDSIRSAVGLGAAVYRVEAF